MNIQSAINALLNKQDLDREQMRTVMELIMTGQCTDAQIGGFLVALRAKGETVDEITGAAQVMRELATAVDLDLANMVDIVGTGGDSSGTFNVSTASTFVAAAGGARVAKHGNRSVSSKSGSADLLETAGVCLDLNASQVKSCVEQLGVGFMFAVNHHAAMKYAIGPRRELGVRTVFNLLGPLTNPARVPNMVLGVFSKDWVRPVAEVMRELGANHVMVVNSSDGLDEISVADTTFVAELKNGEICEYSITPEQFNVEPADLQQLVVANPEQSLAMVELALSDADSAAARMVSLNAGAALYVSGVCADLQQGINRALEVIASGEALGKLRQLAEFSQSLKQES